MSSATVLWRGKQVEVPHLNASHPEIHFRAEFFSRAFQYLHYNGIDGDYAEFGSASARTFRLAWNCIKYLGMGAKLWSFDSFEGLPPPSDGDIRDYHPQWQGGSYATPIDLFKEIVKSHGILEADYRIIPGFYDKTIGRFAQDTSRLAPNIGLAYIDCDLYSSTSEVLFFLTNRIKHGMIVAFDDYFCYSSKSVSGERLAMLEFLRDNPRWEFVPYHPISWHGQSFIVEAKDY